MKKISNRDYAIKKIADFIGVILLVGILLFIWQLYRDSIAIPFLKPYIIKALNHDDTDYEVTLDGVYLELVRSVQPLRIIAGNVVYKKENAITITAPKVALSFNIKALLRGVIAPSSIDIDQPKIYVYNKYNLEDKKSNTEINQKKLEYYFDVASQFWERFNSEDNIYPESYINDINITNADVEVLEVDFGKKWQFSDVNYHFNRGMLNLKTEINALMPFATSTSSIGMTVEYNYKKAQAKLGFYFSDLIPSELLNIITSNEASKEFNNINIPLHGNISTVFNFQNLSKYKSNIIGNSSKIIDKIIFELNGEKGTIKFADDENYAYDISGLILKGELNGDLEHINITDASLNLDNQTATLGLNIEGLKDWLISSNKENLKIKLRAKVPELETDKLSRFWPKYFGEKAWMWCKESLFGGKIKNGNFTFNFAYDKKLKSVSFSSLSGDADIEDGNIIYLNTMPKVSNIYGKALFSEKNIKIDLNKAKSDDVVLNYGYVDLYDLNKEDNFLKLEINATGTISDILKLIDHEPLKYTSELGVNPDIIKGMATADLMLAFELRQDLDPNNIEVNVNAKLNDVSIQNAIQDKSFEAKVINFVLDNKGMNISGVANIDDLPLNLIWNENFDTKDYQRRYQISFSFDDNFKQKLGLNTAILTSPYIKGTIPTKAIVTVYSDNKTVVDVHGDLRDTHIDYGFLGFKKKAKTGGEIIAQINVDNSQISSIPQFSLSKPDFKLNGEVSFDDSGNIKVIDIKNIKGTKTNAKAKIDFGNQKNDAIKIIVSGSTYDLSDLFARDEDDIEENRKLRASLKDTPKKENEEENIWENIPSTNINIAVDKLWTNDKVSIRNFAGSAKILNKTGIEEMHIVGNFKPNKNTPNNKLYLKLDYTPRPNNEYLLDVESNDAGKTLRFLRLYDYMRGGSLSIKGKQTADKNFIGHAKARNFNIVKTNVFAKLLTLASFTGIVDMLSGDGIAFTHFDAPFEYKSSTFILKDAKAFGNVIGISLNGAYNSKYQEFDIRGLIAPAYGLNTFLGKIPLVGTLLSGKDGTIFAVNYQIAGNIDEQSIDINPLSALSPNSVKDLWKEYFENDNEE
ncbi:MAG: AsmA-like C-terminal domain-containing protein [Alphaproteobacteria bacterium]|nr:AsmA-like C-terminal domain-containing protein [Alphaproteobacteria bacterium]